MEDFYGSNDPLRDFNRILKNSAAEAQQAQQQYAVQDLMRFYYSNPTQGLVSPGSQPIEGNSNNKLLLLEDV
jgi:hypothetical protein